MAAKNEIDDVRFAFEGLGRQVDQITRLQLKLKDAFYATHIGGAFLLAGSIGKLAKASAGLYKDQTEITKAQEGLTKTSKAIHAVFLKNSPVMGLLADKFARLNDEYEENRTHLKFIAMRMQTFYASVITLAILLGGLSTALVLFTLHTQGADAAVLDFAEGIPVLEQALDGLLFAMSGEGEGGLFSGFLGGALLAGVATVIFGATVGKLVLALTALGSVFHFVEKVTGSVTAAMTVTVGVASGMAALFLSKFALVRASAMVLQGVLLGFFNMISTNAVVVSRALTVGVGTAVAAVSLLAAGIYGMVQFTTGAMSGWKAAILGVFSAIAIGVSLFLLGVAAIPAAIVAAVVLALASIYRFRDEIWGAFLAIGAKYNEFQLMTQMFAMRIVLAMMMIPSQIYTGFVDGFNQIRDWITNWVDDLVAQIDYLKSKLDFELPSMPGSGLASTISGYNPFRAEGGPVAGGRPYIVGEKGPELFVPGSSGNIVANDQLGGGGSVTLNINVAGVTDRTDKRALAREIGDMLTQELRRQGGAPTRGRF